MDFYRLFFTFFMKAGNNMAAEVHNISKQQVPISRSTYKQRINFTQKKSYRSYPLKMVLRLSEDEAWSIFKKCRFGEGDNTKCPDCLSEDNHSFISTRKQWACKNCKHRFSVTSGTPFSNRKLSLVDLLTLIHAFVTSPQGVTASSVVTDTGIAYKTAYLNLMKIREALHGSMDLTKLEGIVHIGCLHICGKPRKGNVRLSSDSASVNSILRNRKNSINPDKKTAPEPHNIEKFTNRRIVLAMSQIKLDDNGSYGSDRTIFYILESESWKNIMQPIEDSVSKDAIIMTDKGPSFNKIEPVLGIRHFSVNHSQHYMDEFGVTNNMAESFFSRIRRAEFGTYNGMSPKYLAFYVSEFAYRNDHNKNLGIEEQMHELLTGVLSREPSKAFTGYYQGYKLPFEYTH